MMRILLVALVACAGCAPKASQKKERPSKLSAGLVTIESYKVEGCSVDDSKVRAGLLKAAGALSGVVEAWKTPHKKPYGTMKGTFRTEPDGLIRMFLRGATDIKNAKPKELVEPFSTSLFKKKNRFPALGARCLITAQFRIKKAK